MIYKKKQLIILKVFGGAGASKIPAGNFLNWRVRQFDFPKSPRVVSHRQIKICLLFLNNIRAQILTKRLRDDDGAVGGLILIALGLKILLEHLGILA